MLANKEEKNFRRIIGNQFCVHYLHFCVSLALVLLKGGYRNFFYSFIGPVGYNIWWENSQNGSFGPKKGPKTPTMLKKTALLENDDFSKPPKLLCKNVTLSKGNNLHLKIHCNFLMNTFAILHFNQDIARFRPPHPPEEKMPDFEAKKLAFFAC